MAYWLFKTEPGAWSWEQQKAKGAAGEPWSGVRNHQAANNMKAMKKGERGFFYHSGDVKAVADLPQPVTLQEAKQDPKLAEMVLVKFSRLSVQPVRDAEWKHICKLGGVKSR
jgi:predicted RNA-binding protein with PUA-like domain